MIQKIIDFILGLFQGRDEKRGWIPPAKGGYSAEENPIKETSRLCKEITEELKNKPEKKHMKLEVLRFSSQKESTLGILSDITEGRKFLCFTLEDEYRTEKVYSETRIPAGSYNLALRTEGGFHDRYQQKFPDIHKGMLWVQEVPGFEYILIHVGNRDDDTAGCLLVGDSSIQNVTEDGMIGSSTAAYKRIYLPIAAALERGEEVSITYIDYDTV